jgi:hypothetical protein
MFCHGAQAKRRKDGFRRCRDCGFKPRRIIVYPDGFLGTPVILVFAHPDDTRPQAIFPFDGIQPRPRNAIDVAEVMRRWRPHLGEVPKISVDDDVVICDAMRPANPPHGDRTDDRFNFRAAARSRIAKAIGA